MSKRRSTTATQRLKQDYIRIIKDPVPYITAQPLQSNILEWHYVVQGPENTPYEGGIYHGKLLFPSEFPYKPPSIYMITPNGRFKCNTRLCLSISDFHPDTWNPAWSVSTILTGLLSFMVEKNPTLGSIETTDFEKRQLATSSGEFNLSNKIFCDLFPNILEQIQQTMEKQRKELEGRNLTGNSSGNKMSTIGPNSLRQGFQHNGPGFMGSTLINIIVIVGFAAFAYTVKYVLKNIGEADF